MDALRVVTVFLFSYVTKVNDILSRFRARHPLVTYAIVNLVLNSLGAKVVLNNALRLVTLN